MVGGTEAPSAAGRDAGMLWSGTYSNECEGASRIDSDAIGKIELGAGALAIVEARNAGAGKRGCLAAVEVDLADAVVGAVLTCI